MDKLSEAVSEGNSNEDESVTQKIKCKLRCRKRKRKTTESSSESQDSLPENILEVEKNLQASAIRNNLDDTSMKKLLKKVVTNDHVLALVALREEEEAGKEEKIPHPKITRAKAKALMKDSPQSAAWPLELTPIKHIPVKTTPEVTALIAQDLPEDEDDDEYEPAHDDVPSDDDQTLESCSDLDSQPRTPATPGSNHTPSPKVVKDGPFKVPLTITPARRKLDLEEEATIALRTRSKLSLSKTSIEHIESSFVPPDDLPTLVGDDLWNQFLMECLNPGPSVKHEDDDEADPEYNVAADPDAHEEDEALEGSIIKISKKELNDLMTELFDVMPESTVDKIAQSLTSDDLQTSKALFEGKQEPQSDDEKQSPNSSRIIFEKDNNVQFSIGKSEPMDLDSSDQLDNNSQNTTADENNEVAKQTVNISLDNNNERKSQPQKPAVIQMTVVERDLTVAEGVPTVDPPPVVKQINDSSTLKEITVDKNVQILPDQVLILQQQLRQHIQLCASNFLQLYVNPTHWALAPKYKEYLETLNKMTESNSKSIAKVCNLKLALELVNSWETSVSENTPENTAMVKFIQNEADRSHRRAAQNCFYAGDFHEVFLKVISNSAVFQYPHLLPPMPYRPGQPRRYQYLPSEDSLIAIGLQQFWEYIELNPELYKRPNIKPQLRWGLSAAIDLICKVMLPWYSPKTLLAHISHVRRLKDKDNPINKLYDENTIEPVKHEILPFSETLTLYQQPVHDMPKIWMKYLAKHSKRFRRHYFKRGTRAVALTPKLGVPINIESQIEIPKKLPLPIDYFDPLPRRSRRKEDSSENKYSISVEINPKTREVSNGNLFSIVETTTGSFLVPYKTLQTNTVYSTSTPITSSTELKSTIIANDLPEENRDDAKSGRPQGNSQHCACCLLLRKIYKIRQPRITEYFKPKNSVIKEVCPCKQKPKRRISKRLKLLVKCHKNNLNIVYCDIHNKLKRLKHEVEKNCIGQRRVEFMENEENDDFSMNDLEFVRAFEIKVLINSDMSKDRRVTLKRQYHKLLKNFDYHTNDPVVLARSLERLFDVELVDIFKEFLCFLTPEQAQKLDYFKDYFVQTCMMNVVEKLEGLVTDKTKLRDMLDKLHTIFYNNSYMNSCALCSDLMCLVDEYAELVKYVFSLFPHRNYAEEVCKPIPKKVRMDRVEEDQTLTQSMENAAARSDYEADYSSSDEDVPEEQPTLKEKTTENVDEAAIDQELTDGSCVVKMEIMSPSNDTEMTLTDNNNTAFKIETDCPDSSDESSMLIILEEDEVKTEFSEWKREEDKLILEVLKEHVSPRDRKDKSILEIVEESSILNLISESLIDKSVEEIQERMMYILQMLVLSEKS